MLTVKGYYRNHEITLLEPLPAGVQEAELNIIVLPKDVNSKIAPSSKSVPAREMSSEEEFEVIGMRVFGDTDDKEVDWEEWFGLK